LAFEVDTMSAAMHNTFQWLGSGRNCMETHQPSLLVITALTLP